MFYLAGIIITFFLSVLLAGKKGKSNADIILTAWLVIIGFHLTAFYLYLSGDYVKFSWFLGFDIPLPLVHGPFLFLYTTALTQERKIKVIDLLHCLPIVITLILMLPFFRLSQAQKISVYQNEGVGYEWLTGIVFVAVIISGVVYVVLSFLKLRRHRVNIENQFSNTARINLNWLRYLIYGSSVIWIVVIVGLDDYYVFGTVVLYVFFIGYFGIRQIGVFSNLSFEKKGLTPKEPTIPVNVDSNIDIRKETEVIAHFAKPKYQKSSLTEDDAKKVHDQLLQLMAEVKYFKDPELSLKELATKLNIHPNALSQVINSFENKTFYDYINGLRIGEFKTLIADPHSSQYTLLSLAFECGFNSKTAFNRNFRKATGLSPSEYLNQLKINLV